jgi:hypothetical protein
MNAGDGIQIGVGAVLMLTLLAVLWYAVETHKLVHESREQRLNADRPYVLIEVQTQEELGWQEAKVAEGTEPDPHAAYPKDILCRIQNAGRGPAKEIAVTLLQPHLWFGEERRDVLRPEDPWYVHIKPAEKLRALVQQELSGRAPLGMHAWMKMHGIESPYCGDQYDCGLVVTYGDIHDRRWATYLKFSLILRRNSRDPVTRRTLMPVEHRIVEIGAAP